MISGAKISDRVASAKPSLTKAFTQKARELAAKGVDVITLSQGELDFDTPSAICEAGIDAIRREKTRYTEVAGILPLREAVVVKFKRDNDIGFSAEQITIGVGAKQLLFNALFAVVNPGDEVLFPTPCSVSYPEMVSLVGGVPVPIETVEENGWLLQPYELHKALSPRTRALMLNNPANPTGSVYEADDLARLAELLRSRPDVWVLSDKIYEPLVYDGFRAVSFTSVAPDLLDRIVVVNGVSKSAAMTG